jgi:hypothetical protein
MRNFKNCGNLGEWALSKKQIQNSSSCYREFHHDENNFQYERTHQKLSNQSFRLQIFEIEMENAKK